MPRSPRFPARRWRPLVVLLASLAAALAVAGAGTVVADEATPAASPTATDVLREASRRLAETQTVHFDLDVEGDTFLDGDANIRLLEAEGDLSRPDRVRASFRAEVLGQNVTLELITVGDQTWTTDLLTGKWQPAPPEFAYRPSILFDNQQGIGPVMGRVEDAQQLEDEEVDGRKAYRIRAKVAEETIGPLTYETMVGSPVTVDLWIDRETFDLLRARLSEPPSTEGKEPATWTLELSDHGEPVTIEPPV